MTTWLISGCGVAVGVGVRVAVGRLVAAAEGVGVGAGVYVAPGRLVPVGEGVGVEVGAVMLMLAGVVVVCGVNVGCGVGTEMERDAKFAVPRTRMSSAANIASALETDVLRRRRVIGVGLCR